MMTRAGQKNYKCDNVTNLIPSSDRAATPKIKAQRLKASKVIFNPMNTHPKAKITTKGEAIKP